MASARRDAEAQTQAALRRAEEAEEALRARPAQESQAQLEMEQLKDRLRDKDKEAQEAREQTSVLSGKYV